MFSIAVVKVVVYLMYYSLLNAAQAIVFCVVVRVRARSFFFTVALSSALLSSPVPYHRFRLVRTKLVLAMDTAHQLLM